MGLGRGDGTSEVLGSLLDHLDTPFLIDADGVYHLSDMLEKVEARTHPTEFARLVDTSIEEVLESPFSYSRDFDSTYLVLKGPVTIITSPNGEQRVDLSGNAGLAKGGNSDVLSGILLAMVLRSSSIMDALSNGCVIYDFTAETLTKERHSKMDLLTSGVIAGLSQTFRTFSL